MSLSDSQSCSSTTSADNNEAHKSSRHNYSESQRQHYSESADNSALNYCVPTSSDNTNAGTNSFAIFSNKFANDGTFMEMFKRMQQMQQIAKGDPDDENGRGENAADSSSSLTEARFQSNEKMPKGGVDTSTRYNHDHISSTTSTTTTSRASSNSPIHNSKTSSALPKSSASVSSTVSGSPSTAATSGGLKRKPKVLKVGKIERDRRDPDEEDGPASKDAWSRYMNEVRKYKEKFGDDEDKNRPLVK